MKVLIHCASKFNLRSKNLDSLGGVETLNINLAQSLNRRNIDITLATICNKTVIKNGITNIPIKLLKKKNSKIKFDTIISSNDASIFNYFKSSKKIFWLHNVLQVEKAIRKNQFFSLIRNNPIAIFVSNYLKNKTSKLFFFKKKITISNFLSQSFINKKINYIRKPVFIWSVQREKGLDKTIEMWATKIFPCNSDARLKIFGIKKLTTKYNTMYLKSKNIFFMGRVDKKILIKNYNISLAMICLGYDETFCLNALEANSCGLPILTFAKTALKEYVKHKKNGLIVKDYEQLSVNILKLLKQTKTESKKYINNSIAKSQSYHINNIIKYWIKLI